MPKCPICNGNVEWIIIENERLGASCRVADDCPRCYPHCIELPDANSDLTAAQRREEG